MNNYLYSKTKQYKLYHGKMQEVLRTFENYSIDSIVCDPPYEINFMGKGWDNSGVAFQKETWEHCYNVLKPGGYLLAFGGSRTFHRIACAIEDAGFEIRDCIMWLYGSGFPKSMNIGLAIDKKLGFQEQRGKGGFQAYGGILGQETRKAKLYKSGETVATAYTDYKSEPAKSWGGWGTCLKPAYEPVIIARKPFKGSLIDNVINNGVGGLNIDECRVGNEERFNSPATPKKNSFNCSFDSDYKGQLVNGRFPANVILTYDDSNFDEVCGGFPNTNKSSASRYFYSAKASKKDRDEGLDFFKEKKVYGTDMKWGYGNNNGDNLGDRIANVTRKNTHPTVKPTELMQYLIRLVTPKGGTILDPFMGSGSTGKAAMYENKERNANYHFIGVEMTNEYLPICKARIDFAL